MAVNFNKVILAGRLTRDPEIRYAANGTAVARFGLAVNTTSGQGDHQKASVCFVDVTVFGRQGEAVAAYLTTGSAVMLEGRLEWQTWKAHDGQSRSKHTVVAERVDFLSPRRPGTDAVPVEVEAEAVSIEDAEEIPF